MSLFRTAKKSKITSLLFCLLTLSGLCVHAKTDDTTIQYYILGLNWQKKGNYEEAEKAFRKAVQLMPSDAGFQAALANILATEGKTEDAILEFNKATNLEPANVRIRVLFGKVLMQSQRFASAAEQFKVAVQLEPNYPFLYFNLGQAEYKQGEYEISIPHLQKALLEDLENTKIVSLIATAQHKLNKFEEAITNYKWLLVKDPDDEFTRVNLARAYYQTGNVASSVQEYEKLINDRPNRTDLLSTLADMKFKQGNANEAINLMNKALNIEPNDATLHAVLAGYYDSKSNLKDALTQYQVAAQLETNEETKDKYQIASAQILFKKGDYNQASKLIEDILAKNPNSSSLKVQLADIRLWQKKYNEATILYRDVLSQDSSLLKNKQVLFNYGASLNGIKDWPNAEIVWTNYLKLDKNSKEGWLNLASAESAQKKYSEAINSYQMALNYGASKLDTLTQISNLQVQNKDYEGAEASYKELISLKPDSVKYRLTLSRILAKAGKNDESLKLLKESSQIFPSLRLEFAEKLVASGDYYSAATEYQKVLTEESNNFDAVMGLADSYAAIGQFSEAAKLYKRYLVKYADNFHAQYNYALALASNGKEAESVVEYKKAIEINPYNPDSYYALGAVLIDKDAAQARENWKRYLELQPQGEFRREILHQFPDLKND